jgi:hypothetical protein
MPRDIVTASEIKAMVNLGSMVERNRASQRKVIRIPLTMLAYCWSNRAGCCKWWIVTS